MAGGLFKGMTGGQALGFGQGMLGMGMDMAFKKQAMDLELKQKQAQMELENLKFNLLKSVQEQQMKNEQDKLKLDQDKLQWEKDIIKEQIARETGEKEERKGVVYGGRRPAQIDPFQAMARKGFVQTGQAPFLNMLQPQQPEKPLVVPPEASIFTGDKFLQAPGKVPQPAKPSFSHIKASQGGLRDVAENKWLLEPPVKEGEKLNLDKFTKILDNLDKLGMTDSYWDDTSSMLANYGIWGKKKGKLKETWLKKFLAGKEVDPDLAAQLKIMFPETKIETAKPKATESQMKKAYELWKQSNTGTYEEFKAQLQ